VWPTKFKPDLPARYDGTPNPTEFLQLYTLSIEAANDDDKVMANWFPMALKDFPRSWIMNLPEASISSWAELCWQFVSNFKGTHECPLTLNDLRAVRQRPDETLCKYIQRFSQVCNKIPRASDAAIISAFSSSVTDVWMREKLAINDELDTVVELFDLADKCAKAEEGRLFIHNDPDQVPDAARAKSKDAKRKGPAVLAAEPEQKRGRDHAEPKKDGRPYCAYHDMFSHNTEDCHELKLLRDERLGRRSDRNNRGTGHGGGHNGGRWGDRSNNGNFR
jgi:hypothetical protein